MELTSTTRLALRRSVQVVPCGGVPSPVGVSTVLIAVEGQGARRLDMPGFDLLRAVEMLQAGTTLGRLAGEIFGGDEGCAGRLIRTLQRIGVLMVPVAEPESCSASLDDRFDRLLGYLAEFEGGGRSRYSLFARLREAHVVFVGLGSMTSWVLSHLVASGVGQVTGIDPDRVVPSNLARQALYAQADVGAAKLAAAGDAVARLSDLTRFEGLPVGISSVDEARRTLRHFRGADLVVLTADQPLWLIAEWVAAAAVEVDLPLLRVNVRGVGPLWAGPGTACPGCELQRLRQSPGAGELLRYRSGSSYRSAFNSATISTAVALHGALAAHEAIGFLTGAWPAASVNARLRCTLPPTFSVSATPVAPRPDCPACSPSHGRATA